VSQDFVVDASIAVAWIHPAQKTAESETALSAVASGSLVHAPSLWPLEGANALVVLERRGKLTRIERDEAFHRISRLPVKLDSGAPALAFGKLAALSIANSLSIYDSAYLELAQRMSLPLACKDGPLKAAAKRLRLPLWRP
jgi:predicted nucleic acid-binding protein